MPIIIIDWLEGRTADQKSRLATAITKDMAKIVGVAEKDVTIVFHDLPKTDAAVGGVLATEWKK